MDIERRLVLYTPYSMVNAVIEPNINPLGLPEITRFLESSLVHTYGVTQSFIWEWNKKTYSQKSIKYPLKLALKLSNI